jgi:DNA-binding transcriptional ArsR family regulator
MSASTAASGAVPIVKATVDLAVLAKVGEALADPTRRGVLAELIVGPDYPAELADRLGVSRSKLSNHLACLRGCGFVTPTYEGRRVRYALADPAIATALLALGQLPLGPCPEDGAT